MKSFIFQSLVANASSLGVHWIYNHHYLKVLAEKQSLLFLSQDKKLYDDAKPSYYVYPKNKIGDLSVQGNILTWLYQSLKDNPELSHKEYEELLFSKFKPGGDYQGYVESYAKKLVIRKLSKDLHLDMKSQQPDDDHLVGFIPYLATKSLNISRNKAIEFTKLFSNKSVYIDYMNMFDHLLIKLENTKLKDAILEVIEYAPISEKTKLSHISDTSNIDQFIENFAGRACSIDQSVPLIFYILYHAKDFTDALNINAQVGGASSDRALLLACFLSQVYSLPLSWKEKVKPILDESNYHH